ncbi:hypothetical protein G6F68_020909 [Rhizopus microsporus]|nr:hypothetical protein G6F68_020909 [Rhizopus microsporus]
MDARILQWPRRHARHRLGHRHRARPGSGLEGLVRALRQAAVRQAVRTRHRLRRRGFCRIADHCAPMGHASAQAGARARFCRRLPAARPRAASR